MKKLNTSVLGSHINTVSKKAKEAAIREKTTFYFDFNEIECRVSETTNLDNLYRDYCNAHLMKWKIIGPDCVEEHPEETKEEIRLATQARDQETQKRQKEYEERMLKEKEEFESIVQDIKFDYVDKKAYNDWKRKNSDPYSRVCFVYAEQWAKRLQFEIINGKNLDDIIDSFEYQPNYLGISGFQHGAARSILKECWKHGNAFKKDKDQ